MRGVVLAGLLCLAVPAFAVDPGRASGTVTIDGKPMTIGYAYAVGRQQNEANHRKDDVRIVLTDKPLPDGTKLDEIDYAFPDGVFGMVVCVDHDQQTSHLVLQHETGMYDAGYFTDPRDFQYKGRRSGDVLNGHVSSARPVKTNTMTFTYDVEFAANVK